MHNVLFSFELMQDGNLEKAKPRPEGKHSCSTMTGDHLVIHVMNSVLVFCVVSLTVLDF